MNNQESLITRFVSNCKLEGCEHCYIIKEKYNDKPWKYCFVIPTKVGNLNSQWYFSKGRALEGLDVYFSSLSRPGYEVYLNKYAHKTLESISSASIYGKKLAGILEVSLTLEEALERCENFYSKHKLPEISSFLNSLVALEPKTSVDSANSSSNLAILQVSPEKPHLEPQKTNLGIDSVLVKIHSNLGTSAKYYSVVNYGTNYLFTNYYLTLQDAQQVGEDILEQIRSKKGAKILFFFTPMEEDIWNFLYHLDDNDPLITHKNLDRESWITIYDIGIKECIQSRLLFSVKSNFSQESLHPGMESMADDDQSLIDDLLPDSSTCQKTDFVELANHPKTPGLEICYSDRYGTYEWYYKGISSLNRFACAQECYVDFVGWLIVNLNKFQDYAAELIIDQYAAPPTVE